MKKRIVNTADEDRAERKKQLITELLSKASEREILIIYQFVSTLIKKA